MRAERRAFAADAQSVGAARRFVTDTLTTWGLHDLEWTATLVISELATNVVIHARTGFVVSITASDEALRLEVHDTSPKLPIPRPYGTASTTGRGLLLVGQTTRAWGVEQHDVGKAVWAELTTIAADFEHLDEDELLSLFDDDLEVAGEDPQDTRPSRSRSMSAPRRLEALHR